ncbi:folylpolyglutamate synthase/dihydrofolate synthase family protein [Lentilactobacillus otakiensis]|uniref:bifunctional folylpolyglutamate synthase/dihydrofolate synthase n=1 Tax=Lentilactobacillus otakiensis TaxID=481720 RepID=UPI001CC00674|nr:folylpolyglutamate synthase/dihydrofolate synthase family protein [Lentilactobacillus otakiensis]MBZ3775629.1 bifunctional folylpolyglutamate synthase/dihydrofolate synthase [Lentilactobacillus otakiensis]MDV3518848.1 folylpolyglutamate synthase/dihydrofolate synthase family protein [Lentilactobacillus otakiensis]
MINTYDEALSFIHGRTKFKKIPTLKRMRRFLDELGAPDKQINAIHIAGTNGKGSTLAFLRNIFQAEGKTVGSFTSPFLIKFNERISVNGEGISDNEILRLTQAIYPTIMKLDAELPEGGPTEFEIVTAMMFKYFAEGHADIVLIEVGLGGLFDSTNVVMPKVSVITSIGWDHMHILGDTLPKIAFQKAGIIKSGVPVVVGGVDPEPLAVIVKQAQKKHSPIKILDQDFKAVDLGEKDWQQHFDFTSDDLHLKDVSTALIGDYQVHNAALAIQAYIEYQQLNEQHVDASVVQNGIQATRWAGRFERISTHPTIVLDGAHNISAVNLIVDTLENDFSTGHVYILMGILADKQADRMVEKIATVPNASIVLTQFAGPGKRAAANPETLENKLETRPKNVSAVDDWQDAIQQLKRKLTDADILLITGSLYFISDVRKYLKNQNHNFK